MFTRKSKVAHIVALSLLGGAMLPTSYSYAADEQTDEKKEEVERIEVTGSRINRVDFEGASPIVVISADDIKDSGFVTAHDALKAVSQNTGTVQGNEWGAQGGFTANADVINLRNLGPGYTLVLVNGRRMAENPTPYNGQSNFVNLSSIPVAAIKRIEILTTGASAVYGSDAVAGVVNIILKNDVEETTVSVQGGTTKDGGGDTGRLQIVTGTTGDNYSLTGTLEYYKQDPIYGKDRDWLDSVDDGPAGVDYLTRGILVYDYVNKTYVDPGAKCETSGSGYDRSFRDERGYFCGFDGTGEYTIQNERENTSAFVTGTYSINDNLELFGEAMFQDIQSYIRGSRHYVGEDVIYLTPDGTGNYGSFDYVLHQRYLTPNEVGEKKTDFDEQVWAATAGIKGSFGDSYEWQFYFNESRYDYKQSSDRLKEEKVYEYFFGGYDVLGYGRRSGDGLIDLYDPITQDVASELVGTQVINADSYSRTFAFELTGDLFELPAGMVSFAAIAEMNTQGYDLKQDDRTLNKDGMGWYNLTGTTGGGDRDRYAVGAELLIPLYEGLDMELAGRYDEYDDSTTDVGGRFTPSVKLTYRPIDELMFRGSYGESFRAPDMHYVFAGDSGFYQTVYDWSKCQQDWDPNDGEFVPISSNCDAVSVKGSRSGSKTLQEEKGKNWAFGIVSEPIENLSLTLDWYKIELRDIVGDESVSGLLSDEYDCNNSLDGRDPNSGFCQSVYSKITRTGADGLDPGALEGVDVSPVNKSRLSQEGIDASFKYSIESEYGDFLFSATYTHILSTKYQATDEDEFEEIRDKSYNDDARSKVQAQIAYGYSDFAMALTMFRTGSIVINEQPAENYDDDGNLIKTDRLDPYYTYNFTMNYQFTDNFRITGTIVNLFDERPPEDKSHETWPYYNQFAYGGAAVGQEYFLEASYTF